MELEELESKIKELEDKKSKLISEIKKNYGRIRYKKYEEKALEPFLKETERVQTEQNQAARATTRARQKAAAAGFDPSRLRIKNPKRVAEAAGRITERFAALRQKEAEQIEL